MKWLHVLLGVIFVLVLWLFVGLLLPGIMSGSNEPGVFGDQFGAVNALFSGLAFAGVIYAVILQSKELQLQRDELEQTREVLIDQKRQLEEQNITMQQQRFETTFFQMLSLHNEIVESLEHSVSSKKILHGRICFSRWQKILVNWTSTRRNKGLSDQEAICGTYNEFYKKYQHLIGHYFRNLYTIIKIVDRSSVENKRDYTNIVRAQLSSSELVLLFYNCISPWGMKFKPLVEKYALLKTLPEGSLADERDRSMYAPSAFGEKENNDA